MTPNLGKRTGLVLLAFTLASVALPALTNADAGDAGSTSAPTTPEVSDPDAPTVAGRVEGTEFHVGDPIPFTITTVARKGVPVNLPNVIELGKFSLLDRSESQADLGDGRIRREFALKVATYEPGPATLPAVDVTYLDSAGKVRQVRTSPQTIKIASLLANEPEPALKENSGPIAVMKQDLTLAYVAGGVVAAALGGLLTWLIVRKMRKNAPARPGPPPRPAHEIALERLDRLGSYGFLENADNRPFYFSVSEIIRDYLGGRFAFDSLELTTDELVAELKKRAGQELVMGEIKGWLAACDLVKFAKVSPTATEARGTLEVAIRIVESTRPRPAPAVSGVATSESHRVR